MALENDTQAPDFDLANQFGERMRLSDFRGVKPVALVFFPLAFSSVCTGELCALRDNLDLFKDHGVELIGISVDSKATLRAWAEQEGYDFKLLADFWPHGAVAKEYGVFLEDEGLREPRDLRDRRQGRHRVQLHDAARRGALHRASTAPRSRRSETRSANMGVHRMVRGPLAQLVERHVYTVDVVGSSPAGPTATH